MAERKQRAITVRMTLELVRRIDAFAAAEGKRLGVVIARETIIRQILAEKVRGA